MSDDREREEIWRVGRHYGIHVYEVGEFTPNDRPIATFHDALDAERAVVAVNRGLVPDEEFVLMPPRGWANRIDEVLRNHFLTGPGPYADAELEALRGASVGLADLVRGWVVGLDNDR